MASERIPFVLEIEISTVGSSSRARHRSKASGSFLGHDAWTTRQILVCLALGDEKLDRELDIGPTRFYLREFENDDGQLPNTADLGNPRLNNRPYPPTTATIAQRPAIAVPLCRSL